MCQILQLFQMTQIKPSKFIFLKMQYDMNKSDTKMKPNILYYLVKISIMKLEGQSYFPNPNIFMGHCLYHCDKINTLPSTCCQKIKKTSTKRKIIPILDYYTSSEDISIDLLEQFSDTFYPNLYCGCVEASEKACYEQNILELWGDQVHTQQVLQRFCFMKNLTLLSPKSRSKK